MTGTSLLRIVEGLPKRKASDFSIPQTKANNRFCLRMTIEDSALKLSLQLNPKDRHMCAEWTASFQAIRGLEMVMYSVD